MVHLIVGLGNPGKKYENSRHNTGFRVVEKLARKLVISPDYNNKYYLKGEGKWEDQELTLVQPLTYMNRSGLAVARIMKKNNLSPEHLVVVYDDMDIEPGRIKIKPGGSSGGHRGINSIIDYLGSTDFVRIKIGIGRPPPWIEGPRHVLGKPGGEEKEDLEKGEDRAVQAVLELVSGGLNQAMNKYNQPVDS